MAMVISPTFVLLNSLLVMTCIIGLYMYSIFRILTVQPHEPPWKNHPPPTMPWDKARLHMGNGDTLLVRNNTAISRIVNVFARSWYSHVALVVYKPSKEILQAFHITTINDTVYVLECNVPYLTLVPLHDWLLSYAGEEGSVCTWRKLIYHKDPIALGVHGIPATAMESALYQLRGRLYPTMLQILFRRLRLTPFVFSWSSNCVETVCDVFRSTGLLSLDIPTQFWSPDDFASHHWGDTIHWREILLEMAITGHPHKTSSKHDQKKGEVHIHEERQPYMSS